MENKQKTKQKNKEINVNSLSRKELMRVISNLLQEREANNTPFNRVVISDIVIESNTESLDKCKTIANDLIESNQEFITLRKNKLNAEAWGYIG